MLCWETLANGHTDKTETTTETQRVTEQTDRQGESTLQCPSENASCVVVSGPSRHAGGRAKNAKRKDQTYKCKKKKQRARENKTFQKKKLGIFAIPAHFISSSFICILNFLAVQSSPVSESGSNNVKKPLFCKQKKVIPINEPIKRRKNSPAIFHTKKREINERWCCCTVNHIMTRENCQHSEQILWQYTKAVTVLGVCVCGGGNVWNSERQQVNARHDQDDAPLRWGGRKKRRIKLILGNIRGWVGQKKGGRAQPPRLPLPGERKLHPVS